MRYSSYYLYRKYEKRDGQDVLPVIPATYSFDGEGTMPKVLHIADDPSCSEIQAIYRWVNMDINTDYWCESCSGVSDEYKVKGKMINNSDYTISCNDSTTLDRQEMRQYGNAATAIIGNCVTEIGIEAFTGNTLMNVFIPSSVIKIGASAFKEQITMYSCVLPKTLKSIRNSAFYHCFSLQNLELWDEIEEIGNGAFYGCTSLMHIHIPTKLNTISDFCFADCAALLNVTIPSGVTSIGSNAFEDCRSLTGATIPDSVTTIGDYAFGGCEELSSINIPSSVTYVGEYAFVNCTSLPVENNIRYADTCAVGTIDKTLSTYTIKNGTRFLDDTFNECINLTGVTIPNSVISIGRAVFYGCWHLTGVTIPNSVTWIGTYAFDRCYSLSSIVIPDSVTKIEGYAFAYCSGLTSVTIGSNVERIYDDAFKSCSGLTSITVSAATPPTLGNRVFDNTNNCPIYVPAASVSAYKSANNWSYYALRIQAIS